MELEEERVTIEKINKERHQLKQQNEHNNNHIKKLNEIITELETKQN